MVRETAKIFIQILKIFVKTGILEQYCSKTQAGACGL